MAIIKSLYMGSKKEAFGRYKHRAHHKRPKKKVSAGRVIKGNITGSRHAILRKQKMQDIKIAELEEDGLFYKP